MCSASKLLWDVFVQRKNEVILFKVLVKTFDVLEPSSGHPETTQICQLEVEVELHQKAPNRQTIRFKRRGFCGFLARPFKCSTTLITKNKKQGVS